MPGHLPILVLTLVALVRPAAVQPSVWSSDRDEYVHDRFVTLPTEAIREFQAFKVSFDTDADGVALGVPDWVAYELRRTPPSEGKSASRPSRWSTDPELHRRGIAPDDSSYRNSGYSRGHMCMKSHAGRLGPTADRETHTVLNACPQMQRMNAGVWLAIENLTGQWADHYGAVWIVTGPVFIADPPTWIGDPGEVPVAVPDAFFKLAIHDDGTDLHVLAFLVPMHGDQNHARSTADVRPYLTSVDIVEALTGLDFLTALPDAEEDLLERRVETSLWDTSSARPRPARSTAGRATTPTSPTVEPDPADLTLRPGREASDADLATATRLVARGWRYVMPRPKSSKAAWGNPDQRTTWWAGYWTNVSTGRASTTRPSEEDDYRGDGVEPGWRRGGAPETPTDLQWLCSRSGGPT